MNNSHSKWQPPGSPPPPQGAIAIQDIVNFYAFFNQIQEPNDNIKHIKAKFEQILVNFADSLIPGAPK